MILYKCRVTHIYRKATYVNKLIGGMPGNQARATLEARRNNNAPQPASSYGAIEAEIPANRVGT